MNKPGYTKALIALLCFILYNTFYVTGQDEPTKTLTGDWTFQVSGDATVKARDWVKLGETFTYTAIRNNSLTIGTDESLICIPEYLTGSGIPDPANRPLNTSYEVGSLPGSVYVSENGAANYSIPLYVAPGTAGMQPSLAISYNSNGGQSILGKGWNLSGISAIYREGSSYYYDGSVDPVDFDNNDAFTLDGSRLISDGSVYKTALENYSEITPTFDGDAITKFTVTTKNGTVIEYGSTPASRQSTVIGSETRYFAWYISKVTDAYGNYMEYTYENDTDFGIRITKIDYTGNTTAGTGPYNTIYFYYEERDDNISSYIYGDTRNEIKNSLLLRKISSEAEGTVARTYNFKYIQRYNESFLAEITETGSDGSRYNPTVFSYYDYSEYNFLPDNKMVLSSGSFSQEKYADFNGDGRADLFAIDGLYLKVYTMNSTGTSFSLAQSIYAGGISDIEVGDFNGDNLADMVVCTSNGSNKILKLYKSTGSQLRYVSGSDKTFPLVLELEAGDVNGDFIDDLLVENGSLTNNTSIYFGDASAPFSNTINFTLDWGKVYLKDIDGDSKNELCNIKDNALTIYQVSNSSVTQFYTYNNGRSTNIVLGDFNGDGKTDFVYRYFYGSVEYTQLAISNGKRFNPSIDLNDLPSGVFFAFDTDNDGRDELLVYNPSAATISPVDGTIAPELEGYSEYRFTGEDFSLNGGIAVNINEEMHDFNGDGITDHIFFFNDSYWVGYKYKGGEKNKLYQIANGLNHLTTIEYSPLNNSQVHSSTFNDATFPYAAFRGAMYVVSALQQSNGMGGYFQTTYTYEGARQFKPLGRFMGFSAINKTSSETGITGRTDKTYHDTYPYASKVENKTYVGTDLLSADYISSSIMNYDITPVVGKRVKKYPVSSESYNYLDQVGTQTQFSFDTNGNITQKETSIGSSGTSTTYYENYITVAGGTAPNVPQTIRRVNQREGQPAFESKITVNYNSTTGFVNYKIIEPDKPNPLQIDYTPVSPGLGLVAKEKVSGSDFADRETTYEWDEHGRYIEKTTSPEGQEIQYGYDPLTGNVLTTLLPTGYTNENTYDGFGRLTFNKNSDLSTSLNWYSGQLNNCVYYAHITGNDSPERFTYYDELGRVLRDETQAYETSKTIVAQKGYNSKGQLEWVSAPFFDGDTEYKTEYAYDDYGRVVEENYASSTQRTTYAYAARQITVTNQTAAQSVTKQFDEYGSVISVRDQLNSELKYEYNSNGGLHKVITPDGEVETTYDVYGRPQQVSDPDLGLTSYTYYVTGELKTQTRYGNTTSYTYNKNGQVQSVSLPEGTTSYTYNATTGQLSAIDGLNNNDVSFVYDEKGRMESRTETIDGTAYQFGYTYKSSSPDRLAAMTYPGGFEVSYSYTNGYLGEIRRGSDNSLIWQLGETSPSGQIEKYTNGNNLVTTQTFDYKTNLLERIQTGTIQDVMYEFDQATGNLSWRMDNKRGLREDFGYDNLNRLTSVTRNGNTLNINYDANGNINSKSDLGTYNYNASQPHALSSITPTTDYSPGEQTTTYTSFDKMATLTGGTKNLTVTYGHDLGRRKTVYTDESTTKTKIFVPGGLEIIDHGNSQIEEYCYISTPAGVTAVYDKTNNAMFYVHPDHLGSIHFITDAAGNTEQELSFDAWGRQRNAADWTYSNLPEPKFERGYTFHEHLAEFGLINMNGRVYDPVVARFLSPDPVTQEPQNLQKYNRYAYVFNNPLKYTDPSGYREHLKRYDEDEYNKEPEPMQLPKFMIEGGGVGGGFGDIGPTFEEYMISKGYAYFENQYGIGFWFSSDEYINVSSLPEAQALATGEIYERKTDEAGNVAIYGVSSNGGFYMAIPYYMITGSYSNSNPYFLNVDANSGGLSSEPSNSWWNGVMNYRYDSPEGDIITTVGSIAGIHNKISKIRVASVPIIAKHWGSVALKGSMYSGFLNPAGDFLSIAGAGWNLYQDPYSAINYIDLGIAVIGIVPLYGDAISLVYMVGKASYKYYSAHPEDAEKVHYNLGMHKFCFAEGSKVLMGNGIMKPIEDIRIGDAVMTYNFSTKKLESNHVLKTDSPEHYKFIKVQFSNGDEIISTEDHPYLIKGKGWCSFNPQLSFKNYHIKTLKLEPFDFCLSVKRNKLKRVKITQIIPFEMSINTYNLTKIANVNNYFVNGILVHNESSE